MFTHFADQIESLEEDPLLDSEFWAVIAWGFCVMASKLPSSQKGENPEQNLSHEVGLEELIKLKGE